jgi:creatinine amidohydrolase
MVADENASFVAHMTWDRVRRRIGEGAAAILPIGGASKQHGLHLPLDTDRVQAELLAGQLARRVGALIWPTVTYGHYPAFTKYAGSISLSAAVFEAMVREIATGILVQGCRALLVLDTGLSTVAPVGRALDGLDQALHLRIHHGPRYRDAVWRLAAQTHGSHADELETSLMLAFAPHLVDMTRAEASLDGKGVETGPLTPTDIASPNYSRSGSFGDPTLATREKGEILLAAIADDMGERAEGFLAALGDSPRRPAGSLVR